MEEEFEDTIYSSNSVNYLSALRNNITERKDLSHARILYWSDEIGRRITEVVNQKPGERRVDFDDYFGN